MATGEYFRDENGKLRRVIRVTRDGRPVSGTTAQPIVPQVLDAHHAPYVPTQTYHPSPLPGHTPFLPPGVTPQKYSITVKYDMGRRGPGMLQRGGFVDRLGWALGVLCLVFASIFGLVFWLIQGTRPGTLMPGEVLSWAETARGFGGGVVGGIGETVGVLEPTEGDVLGEAHLPHDLGSLVVQGPPSIRIAVIDEYLASRGSPAAGTGSAWYALGLEYGIDPVFGIAFFLHESGLGVSSAWAGRKPDGTTTHNVGNIICAGYPTCYGRFRDYPTWEAGISDWYRLIAVEYLTGRGHRTVADIIPVYAPSIENDVGRYIEAVRESVVALRHLERDYQRREGALGGSGGQTGAGLGAGLGYACPVDPMGNEVVITQAYGPTHSGLPRAAFGAVDLAVGVGGKARPDMSNGVPIRAAHAGTVRATSDSGIGGNHVWVDGANGERTGYAHLQAITVVTGQRVAAGDQIGTMGTTGVSSGNHLDLQYWVYGVNTDPTPLLAGCWN